MPYLVTMDEEGRVMLGDKESSFDGRLQLSNFMFAGASHAAPSTGPRRSHRLSTPHSATSSLQRPALAVVASPSPSKSTKRKTQAQGADSAADGSSTKRSKSASPKKRSRPSSSYAPPSTYAHLPGLPDAITPNLLILTIGLNPGLQTAATGHAYAHPSNLYYKLLHSSGITPTAKPCRPDEDQTLPARFGIGHTNLVSRPTRNGAELGRAEMDAGVAALDAKCRRWHPEVACVVGKSIWESVFRVRHGRSLAKEEFAYGWQDGERMGLVKGGEGDGEEEEGGEPWEGTRVFVATSTSGLAATVRPEEKERIWKILGDWCVKRRKEREDAAKAASAQEA
ncbi:DNA glycosylase [Hypoxylon sp. FL1284]|nr:DNA glycosylase [Hypoxylon sp. FL1284]